MGRVLIGLLAVLFIGNCVADTIPPITIKDPGILYVKEEAPEKMVVVFNTPYTMGMNDQDFKTFEAFADGLNIISTKFDPKKLDLTLVINIQGYGGRADLMNTVMTAIEEAEKKGIKIQMNVIGPAASAHAFLTCSTPSNVHINPRGALMFHSPGILKSIFGLSVYKTTGMPDKLIPTAVNEALFNTCIANNKLSKEQVNAIKAGAMVEIVYDGSGTLIAVVEDDADSFNNAVLDAVYNAGLILFMFCFYILIMKFVIREVRKSWKGV